MLYTAWQSDVEAFPVEAGPSSVPGYNVQALAPTRLSAANPRWPSAPLIDVVAAQPTARSGKILRKDDPWNRPRQDEPMPPTIEDPDVAVRQARSFGVHAETP